MMGFKMEDIPDYDKLEIEKINPLEPVVKKIEATGNTLEQTFILLDDNCDELLTLLEIKEGLKNMGVSLTTDEYTLLVK